MSTTVLRVPLRSKIGLVVAHTVIDIEDVDLAMSRRWHLSNHGYAVGKTDGRNQPLHRLLLGLDFGDPRQGDHINGDKLDNRRANLRVVTASENAQNRHKPHGAVHFVGVSKAKRLRRFRAQSWLGGQAVHLGYFDTAEQAVAAVNQYRADNAPFSREAAGRSNA